MTWLREGGNRRKVALKVLSVVRNGEPAGTRTQDPRLKGERLLPLNFTVPIQPHSSVAQSSPGTGLFRDELGTIHGQNTEAALILITHYDAAVLNEIHIPGNGG